VKKLFVFILPVIIFSCVVKKENFDAVRKIPTQKYTPPGTVWLRDNLFLDETEVSNFSYQEFLYWLKRESPALYTKMLPDTNCWTHSDVGNADKLISTYHTRYAYREYPVVGISYEQAIEFCNWRSDRVNEFLYLKSLNRKHGSDSSKHYGEIAPKKVKYRLPTKQEWEYAAAAGLDFCNFPMGYESLTYYNVPVNNTLEYHNYFIKDFKSIDKACDKLIEVNCPTVRVYSGKCNRYGLDQIMGNVSEMVSDSLVKGLNYSTPLFSLERTESAKGAYTITSLTYSYILDHKYKKPEPWIGFRCICEVY
jgi:formylglycine-generating enzyme required for sulfatase activity